MSLWRKKSIQHLLHDVEVVETGLKKSLNAPSLVALGVGAIIGAGLFIRTAGAAGFFLHSSPSFQALCQPFQSSAYSSVWA